jgi:hypothetical protein
MELTVAAYVQAACRLSRAQDVFVLAYAAGEINVFCLKPMHIQALKSFVGRNEAASSGAANIGTWNCYDSRSCSVPARTARHVRSAMQLLPQLSQHAMVNAIIAVEPHRPLPDLSGLVSWGSTTKPVKHNHR